MRPHVPVHHATIKYANIEEATESAAINDEQLFREFESWMTDETRQITGVVDGLHHP